MTKLSEFIEHYCLSDNAEVDRIDLAVTVFQSFYSTVMEHMSSYDPQSKRHGLLLEVYTNLVGRLHEHVSGMLVCLATKNAPSAEALARTVLETSINLIFMLSGDREQAFLAYCDEWFSSHDRQLNSWIEFEKRINEPTGNLPKIKSRMEMLNEQKIIVNKIASKLGMNRVNNFRDAYPKSLFKRFGSIGKEDLYFTCYHRLSNSSHVLAEDTISWLLGFMQEDQKLMLAMGREAVAYSNMMCLIVLVTAIEAIGIFAIAHDFLDCASLIQDCRSRILEEIEKLSYDAGVPQNEM